VVRIWDERRLVVPITHFIERPFQNCAPGCPARGDRSHPGRLAALGRKVKVLQVTDTRERTLELRILASAPDAPSTWNLRCEIREKLVAFQSRPDATNLVATVKNYGI
jgi:hypothetical protein